MRWRPLPSPSWWVVHEHAAVRLTRWSAGPPAPRPCTKGPWPEPVRLLSRRSIPSPLVPIPITLGLSWKDRAAATSSPNPTGWHAGGDGGHLHLLRTLELMAITGTPYADTIDPDLQARSATWEFLSLVRQGDHGTGRPDAGAFLPLRAGATH